MIHDIDERTVDILVRCPTCNRVWPEIVMAESLEHYSRQFGGAYINDDAPECPDCYRIPPQPAPREKGKAK